MSFLFLFTTCTKSDDETETDGPSPEDIVLDMVAITGGSFDMGNTGSAESMMGENLVHTVSVSNFYMGKYEITQQQFEAVMNKNPSSVKDPLMPVESVSWEEAVEFCNLLSDVVGYEKCYSGSGSNIVCDFDANGYRLPTEAEWEYACKAGTSTDFYSGDMIGNGYAEEINLNRVAWYMHNSNMVPHLVGLKTPNAFGLYDMHGNVAEYCWDWFDANYYSISPSTNPTGPSSGTERVERGGRWGIQAYWCRSSVRNKIHPETAMHGFRVVRSAN